MRLLLRISRRAFWIVCRIFPIKENKIVFQTFYGRGYSDNPKYIAEKLRETGKDLDFVWVSNGKEDPGVPEGFRVVRFRNFKYIYEMSTAKIWVDSCRKEYCIKKKNQYYMQTWHGGFAFKKVERAVESELDPRYVRQAKRDAKQTDVMLSNSNASSKVYREDFWYDGEILQKGLPRNDRLFNFTDEDVKSVRESIGIEDGVRLLLYAPTFRKNHGFQAYTLDYERCCKSLEKRFGGKWKILLRMHPGIFDFALLKRRAAFYAVDIDDYMSDRGFYFSLFDFPFEVCQNNDEAEKMILNFDDKAYFEKLNEFLNEQDFSDNGKAADAATEWILNRMQK